MSRGGSGAIAFVLILVACTPLSSTSTPTAGPPTATHIPSSGAPSASLNASVSPAPPSSPPPLPSITAAPSPTPSPTASPTPTLVDATWDIQRVGELPLTRPLSLAIDGLGNAHFVTYNRQGITYWTNASGDWQSERIGSPADGDERDRLPVIALTEAGEVVVAYERSSCFPFGCGGAQIRVTIKTSSGWSDPDRVAAGLSPQIAVMSGAVGLIYTAIEGVGDEACGEPSPVDIALATGRGWQIDRVSADADRPWLAMDVDGMPHILLDNLCESLGQAGVYLAVPTDPTGAFAMEPIPETEPGNNAGYATVVDAIGRTHVIYSRYVDNVGDQYVYVVETDRSWSSPIEAIPGRSARWMAADKAGHVHVLARDGRGVWHATDATGAWTLDQVSEKPCDYCAAALALDAAGRPHVLFGTGDDLGGPTTVWYGVLSEP